MVADHEVDGVLRFSREHVKVDPAGGLLQLECQPLAFALDAVTPDAVLVGLAAEQRDGISQTGTSKADVGQPGLVLNLDFKDHVRARADLGGTELNPGRQATQLESERFEHGGEKSVLFEAISAPPRRDELRLDIGEVERDAATEEDVEILERDCGSVGEMQSFECFKSWIESSFVADAREIGGEVE